MSIKDVPGVWPELLQASKVTGKAGNIAWIFPKLNPCITSIMSQKAGGLSFFFFFKPLDHKGLELCPYIIGSQ